MKNLARLLLALFATQLLVAGFARASITSNSNISQNPVCAMPDDEKGPGEDF